MEATEAMNVLEELNSHFLTIESLLENKHVLAKSKETSIINMIACKMAEIKELRQDIVAGVNTMYNY